MREQLDCALAGRPYPVAMTVPDAMAAPHVCCRADRLRALGNGVVPLQAALALVRLLGAFRTMGEEE